MRLLRQLVSTNKRRYEDAKLGVDLDLSYIVDGRILAMGFPSCGLRSILRNPMHEVQRLLQHHAKAQHWRVYNLCIEPGWQYEHHMLPVAAVIELPLWDAQAPSLSMTHQFCIDAAAWLADNPHNRIAVHCKAGKGRTGALITALLLHLVHCHPQLFPNLSTSLSKLLSTDMDATAAGAPLPPIRLVMPALEYWAHQRTVDGKGLTICSQRRYVSYYAHMLHHSLSKPEQHPIQLLGLVISGLSTRTSTSCLALGPRSNQVTTGAVGQSADQQEQGPQTCGGIWEVPALTVSVWMRSEGQSTPELVAFGWTGLGSSKLKATSETSDIPVQCKVVPIFIDNKGNICMQLASNGATADNHTGLNKGLRIIHSASENTLASSIPSRDSSLKSSCQVAAVPGKADDDVKGAGLTHQVAGCKLMSGDIQVQVIRGHCVPNHPAVFMNRTSVFYAWLNTAFLATHDHHVEHSRRPGIALVPQSKQTQQVFVSDSKLDTCQPDMAALSQSGNADVSGSPSAVTLHVDELDKVDKRLRHLRNVSLQLNYTRAIS